VTLHDGIPVPKVIDFGIAKATQGRLTDLTIYTELRQIIGTPAYMSSEQATLSGLDIDTRSDIYSLGVLLYELLTNTTPFDTRELIQAGLDEMRRIIREQEPDRPSTRISRSALETVAQIANLLRSARDSRQPHPHYSSSKPLIAHFLAHFIDRPLVPSDQPRANPRSIDAIRPKRSIAEWRLFQKPEHWAKLAALVSALSYTFNFSRPNILQGRCRGISSHSDR
jgi:serine/threonine protein kinase